MAAFVWRREGDVYVEDHQEHNAERSREAIHALINDYTSFLVEFVSQDHQLICVWEEGERYTTGLRLIAFGDGTCF